MDNDCVSQSSRMADGTKIDFTSGVDRSVIRTFMRLSCLHSIKTFHSIFLFCLSRFVAYPYMNTADFSQTNNKTDELAC